MFRQSFNPFIHPITRLVLIAFPVSLIAGIVAAIAERTSPQATWPGDVSSIAAVIGIAVILFWATLMFSLLLRDAAMRTGRSGFMLQAVVILSRVVLYIFVPALIITFLLVLWAMHTNQPAFR